MGVEEEYARQRVHSLRRLDLVCGSVLVVLLLLLPPVAEYYTERTEQVRGFEGV